MPYTQQNQLNQLNNWLVSRSPDRIWVGPVAGVAGVRLGYGNMVLGITAESISDPEARKRGLNSELANGRLAMMAIMGLWVQDTRDPFGICG